MGNMWIVRKRSFKPGNRVKKDLNEKPNKCCTVCDSQDLVSIQDLPDLSLTAIYHEKLFLSGRLLW